MIVPDADDLYRLVQAMQKSSTRIMIVGVGTGLLSKQLTRIGFRTSGRDQSHGSRGGGARIYDTPCCSVAGASCTLPQGSLHADKKLEKIEEFNDRSLSLQFQDSSSTVVDTFIGADGIFGSVREHILGSDPSVKPVPAGWAGTVNMVPFSKATAKLGTRDIRGTPTVRLGRGWEHLHP